MASYSPQEAGDGRRGAEGAAREPDCRAPGFEKRAAKEFGRWSALGVAGAVGMVVVVVVVEATRSHAGHMERVVAGTCM